jgi:hypothetical protein
MKWIRRSGHFQVDAQEIACREHEGILNSHFESIGILTLLFHRFFTGHICSMLHFI